MTIGSNKKLKGKLKDTLRQVKRENNMPKFKKFSKISSEESLLHQMPPWKKKDNSK
jgi:hypothetical protein